MPSEAMLPDGRHDLAGCMRQFDQAIVDRNQCGHGLIGYCPDCAAPFSRPGETEALERAAWEFELAPPVTGLLEYPQALNGALLAHLVGFCDGIMAERAPNELIGRAGNPYIDRWFLARKAQVPERSVPPKYAYGPPFMPSEIENLYLHRYYCGDADDPHDHPWPNASLIVRGWYREAIYDDQGRRLHEVVRWPGDIVLRAATSIHAILETSDDCVSLFATLRKERDWGYWTAAGFAPWRKFDGSR